MKLEEALEQTEKILGRTVNVCEKLAIEAAWENKNYKQTAIGATEGSIKIAAKKLWDELSKRLKKEVKKNTFRPLIENLLEPSDRFEKLQPLKENEFLQPLVAWIEKSKNQEWKEALLSEDANYKATPWEAYTVTLHLIRKFPPQSQANIVANPPLQS